VFWFGFLFTEILFVSLLVFAKSKSQIGPLLPRFYVTYFVAVLQKRFLLLLLDLIRLCSQLYYFLNPFMVTNISSSYQKFFSVKKHFIHLGFHFLALVIAKMLKPTI